MTPDSVPPRLVILFSGHMIDNPERTLSRFPARIEPLAAAAIGNTLAEIGVDSRDLALSSGACGGDLLFGEAILSRGAKLELYIPFDEDTFLASSVDVCNSKWHSRFREVRSRSVLHIMPNERGPLPVGENPYERNNIWMLETAMKYSAEKVVFVCLWDGQSGTAAGGTPHFIEHVRQKIGRIYWIDIRRL
jgi:hypothetical protein